jgi:hypothetical protein
MYANTLLHIENWQNFDHPVKVHKHYGTQNLLKSYGCGEKNVTEIPGSLAL